MLVDGVYVADELVQQRAHLIQDGVVQGEMELEEGEPLMIAIRSLLRSTYNASREVDKDLGIDGSENRCPN
tara:strand:+ start:221 stop:433 length:213 start_codon:yes stop_codon:yes gene_type:complete